MSYEATLGLGLLARVFIYVAGGCTFHSVLEQLLDKVKWRLFSVLPDPTGLVSLYPPISIATYKITIQRLNISCNCLANGLDILLTSSHN